MTTRDLQSKQYDDRLSPEEQRQLQQWLSERVRIHTPVLQKLRSLAVKGS